MSDAEPAPRPSSAPLPRIGSGAIAGTFHPFDKSHIPRLVEAAGIPLAPRANIERVLEILNFGADWFPHWRLSHGDDLRIHAVYADRVADAANQLLYELGLTPEAPELDRVESIAYVLLHRYREEERRLEFYGALALGQTEWRNQVARLGQFIALKAAIRQAIHGAVGLCGLARAASNRHLESIGRRRRPSVEDRKPVIEAAAIAFARAFRAMPTSRNDGEKTTPFQRFTVEVAKVVMEKLPLEATTLDPSMVTLLQTLTKVQAGAMYVQWRKNRRVSLGRSG